MKNILLLSSSKFLMDDPPRLFHKPFNKLKMAHIITASKGVVDTSYLDRNRDLFKDQGYDYEDMDLDEENEQSLRERLKNFEIVFVQGGNTFYLLKAIRQSGFEKVIRELMPKGLVYMGASAGSYVACPTIEMATWRHQDKYDHFGVSDLTGMNLVPFLVTVHYKPEYRDLLKEKISQTNLPVRILTDEQAILVRNERVDFIGQGEEIILTE